MNGRHKKIKNTGILFELLIKQVASEILSNSPPKAEKIIKKFFNEKTELNKELQLYQTLINESYKTEKEAKEFINAAISERLKLDNKNLKVEKYNLVNIISESYDSEDFFASRVNNYKTYASIFKLFEDALGNSVPPVEKVSAKFELIEHICRKKQNASIEESKLKEYEQLDTDIRLLAYNLLVKKFNEQYDVLDGKQKKLLSSYINNISNSSNLKKFIDSEIPLVQKEIDEQLKLVEDDIVKIKLTEIRNQLPNYLKGSIVSDRHILVMMRYYELLKELKKTHGEQK